MLQVRNFLTQPKARPLDLDLGQGARLAIMGPAGSGKTRLLEAITAAAPNRDDVATPLRELSAKATPYSLAKPYGSLIAAEALSVLQLWDVRKLPCKSLSSTQQRTLALLPIVAATSGVLALDGSLDVLDPWLLSQILGCLWAKPEVALAVATARPDIAEQLGTLAVLSSKGLRFFGSVDDLLEKVGPAECEIEGANSAAVESVCAPLGLRIRKSKGRMTVKLDEGLAPVARLLLSGYGVVQAVVVREKSVAEALEELG